jgi:hypothetical protein
MCMFVYINIYAWYIYMYVFVCVCVCVCVCAFPMKKSLQTIVSFSGLPSFHSQSGLSVSPCLSRNKKKTNELWIYEGITLRRWLSDVTDTRFQSLCNNIKCRAKYRLIVTLFWRPFGKQRIMLIVGNSVIWLELSCWLSVSVFVAEWLLLKETAKSW